jgi:hypothetical protein
VVTILDNYIYQLGKFLDGGLENGRTASINYPNGDVYEGKIDD